MFTPCTPHDRIMGHLVPSMRFGGERITTNDERGRRGIHINHLDSQFGFLQFKIHHLDIKIRGIGGGIRYGGIIGFLLL